MSITKFSHNYTLICYGVFPLIVNRCSYCLRPLVICILGRVSLVPRPHGRRAMYPGQMGGDQRNVPKSCGRRENVSLLPCGLGTRLILEYNTSINASLHFDAKVTEKERVVK